MITYGTYDLLHQGHINLLRRAKELGDYLIVGVTSDSYDKGRGKLNVCNSLIERIEAVKATGYADEIIVEEYEGQKIDDIIKYGVDIFAIGSDWRGKFDYLKDYCEVVYLERTRGISSTLLRNPHIIKLGIIGCGRIANRFVLESKYVSGVDVSGVYNPHISSATAFAEKNELSFSTDNLDEFLERIDAVYIASPHLSHYAYIQKSLLSNKHVLCEKPLVLSFNQARELYDLAKGRGLVLLEALKTAYSPAFMHLISLVKSGIIGKIMDVEASFTKLVSGEVRELDSHQAGGSMTELGSYPLLPIFKLFGCEYQNIRFYSSFRNGVDIYTKGVIEYDSAIATFKVGLGVKTEGCLIISGTKGYVYVPAPWWKTEYFEVRFESQDLTKKYFYKFDGDGLRYELNDFMDMIKNRIVDSYKLSGDFSCALAKTMEVFLSHQQTIELKN